MLLLIIVNKRNIIGSKDSIISPIKSRRDKLFSVRNNFNQLQSDSITDKLSIDSRQYFSGMRTKFLIRLFKSLFKSMLMSLNDSD